MNLNDIDHEKWKEFIEIHHKNEDIQIVKIEKPQKFLGTNENLNSETTSVQIKFKTTDNRTDEQVLELICKIPPSSSFYKTVSKISRHKRKFEFRENFCPSQIQDNRQLNRRTSFGIDS